ncbi:MAG: hypothetical protein AAFX99_32880, partial [Myxococcota bacterium]
MSAELKDLIKLYIFPRGRREFALGQVAKLARRQEQTVLAEHCEAAVAHTKRTRVLDRELKTREAQGANPRLTRLDNAADRTLSALYEIPGQRARALKSEAEAATTFQDEVFPEGVAAISQRPWPEQLTEMESLLSLLDADHKASIAQFGLEALVEQLRTTVAEFRSELTVASPLEVTTKEVRARDAQGQQMLLEAVAMILGLHSHSTKTDTRARAA